MQLRAAPRERERFLSQLVPTALQHRQPALCSHRLALNVHRECFEFHPGAIARQREVERFHHRQRSFESLLIDRDPGRLQVNLAHRPRPRACHVRRRLRLLKLDARQLREFFPKCSVRFRGRFNGERALRLDPH